MESLRQQVFHFLDDNPNAKNKEIYKKFKDRSESSLRDYKGQYLEIVAKREELRHLFGQQGQLVISTKLDLMKRAGKNIFYEDIPESYSLPKQYDKVAKKNKRSGREGFHIFPLLKTFKLLPLYIFLKVYDIYHDIKESEFPITEIYNSLIDIMNAGIYDIDEISQFSYNCNEELKEFLDHISWKRNTIIHVNSLLGIHNELIVTNWRTGERRNVTKYRTIEERQLEKEYLKIKGKILIEFIPEFYGIYLYFRKKEVIVRDFGKACFLNNFGDNEPVGITELIKRFNDDLEYRKRNGKYHIIFEYNESLEFLDNN